MTQKTSRKSALEPKHWLMAVLSGMASYLDSGVIIATGLSLALWAKEFGFSPLQLGIISSALTFSIAVGALFGGRIADLLGRRRVFNADVLIYVVGVSLLVFASDMTTILIGVVIAGLAAGADLPTSVAVIAEVSPPSGRGQMVAFTQVMWSAGMAVTTAIGFLVAPQGVSGTRIVFAHLAVLGLVTWLLRIFNPTLRAAEEVTAEIQTTATETITLREIFTSRKMIFAILLTGGFYMAWNLMANTIGQFKTYIPVTLSGATQAEATALAFFATILSLIGGIFFARIADTRWRTRLFFVGAAAQIIAMAIGAISGGTALIAMAIWLCLYSMSYPFAGEALYKVTTQESFPTNARATVQGITYSISRFVVAGFAFITPSIIAQSPQAILWMLVGFATAAAVVGAFLVLNRNKMLVTESRPLPAQAEQNTLNRA